ncbi:MAG: hypothetical protein QXD13_01345 [Candidatus Pacearchaeota archaeon]
MSVDNDFDKTIIKGNLEKMESSEDGGMNFLVPKESIGGNAGIWERKYPCAVANFYYDNRTGGIIYFGNYPNALLNDFSKEGSFKIAINTFELGKKRKSKKSYRILRLEAHESSETAREVLEETRKVYNERYGFSPEELNVKAGKV